jgi:predicted aldo/keto reductase-like oxidoreductase
LGVHEKIWKDMPNFNSGCFSVFGFGFSLLFTYNSPVFYSFLDIANHLYQITQILFGMSKSQLLEDNVKICDNLNIINI